MKVIKVFLTNGAIHSYIGEDVEVISIDSNGHLELGASQDDEGVITELVAGYPSGVWHYYRIFEMKP